MPNVLNKRARIALAAGLLFILQGVSAQVLIDKRITILPIQLGNGTTWANPDLILYEDETKMIWAQAGIDIVFLPALQYVNTTYYSNIATSPGEGYLGTLGQTSGQVWSLPSVGGTTYGNTVVRLFFGPLIGGSTGVTGFALQSVFSLDLGGNPLPTQQLSMSVANSAFSSNRRDVIAHELGHLLALGRSVDGDHIDRLGAGPATNLMTRGNDRSIPDSLDDIYPVGSFDFLTGTIGGDDWGNDTGGIAGFQIDRAREMPIAVDLPENEWFYYTYGAIPEPVASTAFAGLAALLAGGIRVYRIRRRSREVSA